MLLSLNCSYCGDDYTTKKREKTRPIQRFCSRKCSSKDHQSIRFCAFCNEKMTYNPANKRTNKKLCSMSCATKFRKLGISKDHKINISKGKIGKPLSESHIESLTGIAKPSLRNENHPNYRRGEYCNGKTRPFGRVEYKNWRRAVFKRDNYSCVICGDNGYIEADHIKPWCNYIDLRYEINNGRTLCKPCHMETDTYGRKAKLA